MNIAREQLSHRILVDALAGPVDLKAVDWHVRQLNLLSGSSGGVSREKAAFVRPSLG